MAAALMIPGLGLHANAQICYNRATGLQQQFAGLSTVR